MHVSVITFRSVANDVFTVPATFHFYSSRATFLTIYEISLVLKTDRPSTDLCSWKSLLGKTSNGHISITAPDRRMQNKGIAKHYKWQPASSIIIGNFFLVFKIGQYFMNFRETIFNNDLDASLYYHNIKCFSIRRQVSNTRPTTFLVSGRKGHVRVHFF